MLCGYVIRYVLRFMEMLKRFAMKYYPNEHLADELAIIIDIMIADYFIKNGHKYDNFSLEEKEKNIIEKRKEILQLISDKPCTCKDYLKNSDIHIRKIDL